MDPQPRPFLTSVISFLTRHSLSWQFLLFLIYNYYIIEAVIASSFDQAYIYTTTTLMPMNIIFFILMSIDLLYRFALTPSLQRTAHEKIKVRKILKYYLVEKMLGLDLGFLVLFVTSYVVQFDIGKYFRYVVLIKLIDIVEFNNKIYEKLHTRPALTKLYTILKISYVIMLFSHYFGTWFYLIDQVLLDQQYYGPPAQNPQLYYQMTLLAYTPIEALDNWGRYLYGLYFMVSLITTIAYGDIIGKNPIEEIYVSVLMVLSTISLGLILQQFMDLVRYDSLGLYDFIKNYNSLKTFMDDSDVSYAIQNKVRSYLVYTQYEKKYHAHEDVAEKLTQKLQADLKSESYSQAISTWIIPCFPELDQHVKDLCNICRLLSFQAQTDIYEQLYTVDTASQCCYLYKLNGYVEQYLELSASRITLPNKDRRHYNMDKLFLNFNMEVAYDSDEQEELEFEIDEQYQEKQQKVYPLVTVNSRRLKSVKISQFVVMNAQDFYQFVNTRKLWYKRIKQLKQQILCRDIQLAKLGDTCPMCGPDRGADHTIQQCPSMHLSYNQRIATASSIHELTMRQQMREGRSRSGIKSRKCCNVSFLLKRVLGLAMQEEKSVTQPLEDHIIGCFKHIIANVGNFEPAHQVGIDSKYDPNGLNSTYLL